MFFVWESDLLNFFIRTLERTDAFVINPYSYWWFGSFLNCDKPIFVRIHSDNIVSMSLHEKLFTCVDISPDEYASCWIIDIAILEDKIRVVQGSERECVCQLKKRIWRKHSHILFCGLVNWWVHVVDVQVASFLICWLLSFNYTLRKLFWRLFFLLF